MYNYGAHFESLKRKSQRPLLETLLEGNIYQRCLDELKEMAFNKGFTEEWLKTETAQLNKDYLKLAEYALIDYESRIKNVYENYEKAANISYEHNFTAMDYADLQFLQTLIKSRILNESQKQPVLVHRIIENYIHTQKGARAICFLVNDNDVGEQLKTYYSTAYNNSLSASEKRFNTSKATELERIGTVITNMTKISVIGTALVKVARERVTTDQMKRSNEIYFGSAEKVI